ncbi:MAG: hypothetical protein ACJAQ3_000619 [Planctomycetota bacterium]|jgi:hypothetical protein
MRLTLFRILVALSTLFTTAYAIACAVTEDGAMDPVSPIELQAAIDAAEPGGVLVLHAGVYELDAPLRLTKPLVLRAAPGAEVVLSAGRTLDLDWTPFRGAVMQADLPDDIDLGMVAFDQLFMDGGRLHMARYPNYDPDARYFGGTAADALSPERIKAWEDPSGGFIHSLHSSEWGGNHWRITGKNADGTLALEGGWMNNRPSGINPNHRFVENIFEELDAPGEWFLDRGARRLYVHPPAGTNFDSAQWTASAIERVIEVVGASLAQPLEGVRLEGLQFAHTARTLMKTDEPLLRSDWMIHRGGAVYAENVKNLVVEDCGLHALGGNGVFVSGFAEGVAVRGCHLSDLGASGVCFVGRPEAVRSPSFNYGAFVPLEELDREVGPKSDAFPRDCSVEDCLMHDLGLVEKQVAGVQIAMASRISVRHVSIYDVPRAGINIGDGTWGGHLIDGCDVFDTVQMTGDHGSFNSWGRDRFWHPNRGVLDRLTSEHPELILLDAVETTTIRNSRWRCDHGWDIDLDDGSSNYEVYNNLCLAGGIKLREGFRRVVRNNVMVNNSFHPHVWFSDSHDVFEKNIVATPYRPIRLRGWGDRIDYNLLPDIGALSSSQDLGLDLHSAAGDPLFLGPATGDFRVADDSPALALGFENFDMGSFGVQKPELRAMARTPAIPPLRRAATSRIDRPRVFLGASVKRLRGLGERSATGLDVERGVLVLDVPEGSPAVRAGLQANDVILRVGALEANDPGKLQAAYLKATAPEGCAFMIFRDQREQTITVEAALAIRLDARSCRSIGSGHAASYDQAKDYLGQWVDASTSLVWDLSYRGDAAFDVYAELAAPLGAAGATWTFSMADQVIHGTTPNTGGWESFERVHLGQIKIKCDGDTQVQLTPLTKPGAGVMNLRAMELVAR